MDFPFAVLEATGEQFHCLIPTFQLEARHSKTWHIKIPCCKLTYLTCFIHSHADSQRPCDRAAMQTYIYLTWIFVQSMKIDGLPTKKMSFSTVADIASKLLSWEESYFKPNCKRIHPSNLHGFVRKSGAPKIHWLIIIIIITHHHPYWTRPLVGPDREAEEASAEPRRMMQSHDATMLLDPWPKGLLPTTLKRWLDGIRYGTMQGVPP